MAYFNKKDLQTYIEEVVRLGKVDEEIATIKRLMVGLTTHPIPDKVEYQNQVSRLNQIFKALLASKMNSIPPQQ